MKTIFTILFILLAPNLLFSQNNIIDSLFAVLKIQKDDTNKVNTLNKLSEEFMNIAEYDKATGYSNLSIKIGTKVNFHKGIGWAYVYKSRIKMHRYKYLEAVDLANLAIVNMKKANDLNGLARAYVNNGISHEYLGKYDITLNYYYKALKIFEKLKNKNGIAGRYNDIGITYSLHNRYKEAEISLLKALKIFKETGHNNINHPYNNLGNIYANQKKYKKALGYYLKSYEVRKKMGDDWEIARVDESIAKIYIELKEFNNALPFLKENLKIGLKLNDTLEISRGYLTFGILALKTKKYTEAGKYLKMAITMGEKSGNLQNLSSIFSVKAELDSTKGNYKDAYYSLIKTQEIEDSIQLKKEDEELIQQKLQYDFDKKQEAANSAELKRNLTINAQINNQKKTTNLILIGLLAFLTLSGFLYKNYRQKNAALETLKATQSQLITAENEISLTRERQRLSQQLHDDLGANLSGLKLYSHLAESQSIAKDNTALNSSLKLIQSSADEIIENLKEIVWAINNEPDTLESLFFKIKKNTASLCHAKGMALEASFDNNLTDQNLSSEFKQNLYLFFKEAINNAIKYSKATVLQVSLTAKAQNIILKIADNGIGFDLPTVTQGHGLKNLASRAIDLGGQYKINASPGLGTQISLSLKSPNGV